MSLIDRIYYYLYFKIRGLPHPKESLHMASRLFTNSRLTESMMAAAQLYYFLGIRGTAKNMNVTRERVRQMLMKIRRTYKSIY